MRHEAQAGLRAVHADLSAAFPFGHLPVERQIAVGVKQIRLVLVDQILDPLEPLLVEVGVVRVPLPFGRRRLQGAAAVTVIEIGESLVVAVVRSLPWIDSPLPPQPVPDRLEPRALFLLAACRT